MRVDLLHYDLDPASIAQVPEGDRLAARLLDLSTDGDAAHLRVGDLAERLPVGAVVIVNDTRVLPARLLGKKRGSGGRAEVFLVRRAPGASADSERWWALGKASKGLKPGTVVEVDTLTITVIGREDELLLVELAVDGGEASGETVAAAVARLGHVPLPPYIRRDDTADDRERYQTMFARVDGAVAAPTAGLHLTPALVARLESRGCTLAPVTLHVGLGTFQPVTVDDLDHHPMHAEVYDIPASTADAIAGARTRGAPVVAIGTTVVRALEAAADPARDGQVRAGGGETRILIQPGHRFRVVDRLFTNFHLPGSTLLALVAAFAGRERILAAYRDAQARGYRFFSYGDAMLLAPCDAARRAPPALATEENP
jgi:S-adenosylmethionine:tRNA ribosyltransferase-isomerase